MELQNIHRILIRRVALFRWTYIAKTEVIEIRYWLGMQPRRFIRCGTKTSGKIRYHCQGDTLLNVLSIPSDISGSIWRNQELELLLLLLQVLFESSPFCGTLWRDAYWKLATSCPHWTSAWRERGYGNLRSNSLPEYNSCRLGCQTLGSSRGPIRPNPPPWSVPLGSCRNLAPFHVDHSSGGLNIHYMWW